MGLTEVAIETIGARDLVKTNERGVANTAEGVVKNMRGHELSKKDTRLWWLW